MAEAITTEAKYKEAGIDQAAVDTAARAGFRNGLFEESIEDTTEVLEEFYPNTGSDNAQEVDNDTVTTGLKSRLDQKSKVQAIPVSEAV